jgi:uncharacterized phage-associated protein
MIYSAKSIANQFLNLANQTGENLTPMKLQKLVYYAHGWYAGLTKNRLINEEIEAWKFGPVIPSLYHQFKQYGASPIEKKATECIGFTLTEVEPPINYEINQFIKNIWDAYGGFTAIKLSDMTHAPDSPWDKTFKKSTTINCDIPFELIKSHFEQAVESNRKLSNSSV